jgi:hypothetical protein
VAGCCECGDELSGSCATALVTYTKLHKNPFYSQSVTCGLTDTADATAVLQLPCQLCVTYRIYNSGQRVVMVYLMSCCSGSCGLVSTKQECTQVTLTLLVSGHNSSDRASIRPGSDACQQHLKTQTPHALYSCAMEMDRLS